MVWGHISTSPSDGACVPDEDDDDHGDGVCGPDEDDDDHGDGVCGPDEDDDDHGDGVCGPDEDRADARGGLYPQAEAHNPVVSHSRVDNTAVQDSY